MTRPGFPMRPARGFSLIELVIAVSIVGILTMIALPSYQQYVLRTNRAVGKSLLTDIAQREEAWFGDRKSYTCVMNLYYTGVGCGPTLNVESDGTPKQSATTSTLYNIQVGRVSGFTVANCSGSPAAMGTTKQYDYVIVATPKNNQIGDARCSTLCLASTGERGASGTDGSACWSR